MLARRFNLAFRAIEGLSKGKSGCAFGKIGEARFFKTNVSNMMNAALLEPEVAPGQGSQKENLEPELDSDETRIFPDHESESSLKIAHVLEQLVPPQHWGINE